MAAFISLRTHPHARVDPGRLGAYGGAPCWTGNHQARGCFGAAVLRWIISFALRRRIAAQQKRRGNHRGRFVLRRSPLDRVSGGSHRTCSSRRCIDLGEHRGLCSLEVVMDGSHRAGGNRRFSPGADHRWVHSRRKQPMKRKDEWRSVQARTKALTCGAAKAVARELGSIGKEVLKALQRSRLWGCIPPGTPVANGVEVEYASQRELARVVAEPYQSSPNLRNACLIAGTFSGGHGFSSGEVPCATRPNCSLQCRIHALSGTKPCWREIHFWIS